MMNEGQDRIKASYLGNYDRLTRIKHRYDPGNTFHINQNILPAGETRPSESATDVPDWSGPVVVDEHTDAEERVLSDERRTGVRIAPS